MKFLKLFLVLFVIQMQAQQGGMWIPSLLKGMNETEMKNLGMKMSVKDIYDVNQSSIKDAVPHFNGGCTAEVISPKGLILTNHHCGFSQIQSHSTVDHDYLTDGFWAYKMEDELPNEGLTVTFMVKIEDVTTSILEGTASLSSEAEKQKKIQENITALSNLLPKENWQENKIRTFYEGNQYMLFVTETFTDVRLVGAPPTAIGKFGSDTDNWVWPRHTGDFSLFRIYADKNNRPAAYSKDNVPYTPKHFLPISLDGVAEDDFTLVFGYPGKTNEYLPAVAIEQIITELNPAKIEVRDKALKIADSFMRKDNAIKIQYASKYASTANYWKKWIGETQGLKKSNAVTVKRESEKTFQQKITKAGKEKEYGTVLADFDKNYTEIAPYALARDYFTEVVLRNTELLSTGYKLYLLEQVYKAKGEQSFTDRKNNLIPGLANFYKNFNSTVDQKVFEQLIELYATKSPKQFLPQSLVNVNAGNLASEIYTKSKLQNYAGLIELLSGDAGTVLTNLNNDPGFLLVKEIADKYAKEVAPKYDEINVKITALQRTYMKALLELNTDSRIFPDANSTLRITYGKVKGYEPKDATVYTPITYLDGVMEKYIPGDYEFDVPEKLVNLYNTKDYGPYSENGKMPVCFIGTNHTTGGNSGSPAIDASGNLVGLNFDRVWEGTMSDLYYDPSICRNIMVDIRYVLFIIDKYAGAKNLITELKLVHPKKTNSLKKKNLK
ncbi:MULTISPECIES: S46 family peptidase [unclassified Flavobacterium]|uniref:S46 family peptidase n=1 Tax=unclassified Flavobacterium TaxID=196869 RepID=UPI000F84532E|nr:MULTISPECIES: S46 family peptidase [unclassified Flavobacterium]RTY71405.1 S46 family peptidase [Flavobacterium sp. LB2P53]RTY93012.1 S46 family peptidase [Flavobacterium sp. RSP46]